MNSKLKLFIYLILVSVCGFTFAKDSDLDGLPIVDVVVSNGSFTTVAAELSKTGKLDSSLMGIISQLDITPRSGGRPRVLYNVLIIPRLSISAIGYEHFISGLISGR